MISLDDFAIAVTADWNDWRSSTARVRDLQGVHWHQPPHAHQPLLHAYVSCGDLTGGSLPHACEPATAPHRIRVCILRCHAIPAAYAELVRRADAARGMPLPRVPGGPVPSAARGW
jgi:hypothetical protein